MFLSFPIDAWLLLLVAVGLGLGLEIAFYWRRRADGSRDAGGRPGGGQHGGRPRQHSGRGDDA